MKIRVVSVGRERADPFAHMVSDYFARTRKFIPLEETILKPEGKEKLSRRILRETEKTDFLVVLDEKGMECDSRELADIVRNWMNRGLSEVTMVIGGADGLPPEVKKAAQLTLALSLLTFPHRIARLLLVEQLYRAMCIIKNVPYQK